MKKLTQKEYRELLDSAPVFIDQIEAYKVGLSGSKKGDYIPKSGIEKTLEHVYGEFYIETVSTTIMQNIIIKDVRLHLVHPVTGEKFFMDGTAGAAIGNDKKNELILCPNDARNKPTIVRTMAIKNAAESLGRIFGRDLNDNKGFSNKADSNIIEKEYDISTFNSPELLKTEIVRLRESSNSKDKIRAGILKARMILLTSAFADLESAEKACKGHGFDYDKSLEFFEGLEEEKQPWFVK